MQRPDPMIPSKPGAEDIQAMLTAKLGWKSCFFWMAVTRSVIHSMDCLQIWHGSTKTCSPLTATEGASWRGALNSTEEVPYVH